MVYDVTYVHPTYGVVTSRQVTTERIGIVNGEPVFIYNDHYNSCPVIKCTPVEKITADMVTMGGRFHCD
jgi:hypothetical protein